MTAVKGQMSALAPLSIETRSSSSAKLHCCLFPDGDGLFLLLLTEFIPSISLVGKEGVVMLQGCWKRLTIDIMEKIGGNRQTIDIMKKTAVMNVFSDDHLAQTFGNHFILGYEISKYDGDLGVPNVYVRLETDEADPRR